MLNKFFENKILKFICAIFWNTGSLIIAIGLATIAFIGLLILTALFNIEFSFLMIGILILALIVTAINFRKETK